MREEAKTASMSPSTSVNIPADALAMLPFSYLTDRADPCDRYRGSGTLLSEAFRDIVGRGIRAYQMHTYLLLVQRFFGVNTRRAVHERQLDMLTRVCGTSRDIEEALQLVVEALSAQPLTVPTERGPVEMQRDECIAIYLLSQARQLTTEETDWTSNESQASDPRRDMERSFAEWLTKGREDITESFEPLFEELQLTG